jgi:hypothetical protein
MVTIHKYFGEGCILSGMICQDIGKYMHCLRGDKKAKCTGTGKAERNLKIHKNDFIYADRCNCIALFSLIFWYICMCVCVCVCVGV